MINFPNAPVNGSKYTHDRVEYTYIRPNVSLEGYWAILTPGTVGVASGEEVDAGVDNSKYVTPNALLASSYVVEDPVTKVTTLTYDKSWRVSTRVNGVAVKGLLTVDGDVTSTGDLNATGEITRGGVALGMTTLFADDTEVSSSSSRTVILSQPYTDFDTILLEFTIFDKFGIPQLRRTESRFPDSMLNHSSDCLWINATGTKWARCDIINSSQNDRLRTASWANDMGGMTLTRVAGIVH